MHEKVYLNAFNHITGIGSARLARLSRHFKLFSEAWQCQDRTDFAQAGIEPKIVTNIFAKRNQIDPEKLWSDLETKDIHGISINESSYPKLLKQIHNPPYLLYVRGDISSADDLALAIIGTRKCTDYGRQVTEQLVESLAINKITIVSGLALGIDSIAHRTTLEAGGRTLAVLGGSVVANEVYPRTNNRLAESIVGSGALISEYPPGSISHKQHFPVRNRLISGLCQGTIVIEAGRRSGALITAFLALEQNREVMAVPGNITAPMSAGTNMLITKGAALVRSNKDVFDTLGVLEPKLIQEARKILPESQTEKQIYEILTTEPQSLDKIVSLTKFDVNVISSTLSIMELKGLVRSSHGGRYIKL